MNGYEGYHSLYQESEYRYGGWFDDDYYLANNQGGYQHQALHHEPFTHFHQRHQPMSNNFQAQENASTSLLEIKSMMQDFMVAQEESQRGFQEIVDFVKSRELDDFKAMFRTLNNSCSKSYMENGKALMEIKVMMNENFNQVNERLEALEAKHEEFEEEVAQLERAQWEEEETDLHELEMLQWKEPKDEDTSSVVKNLANVEEKFKDVIPMVKSIKEPKMKKLESAKLEDHEEVPRLPTFEPFKIVGDKVEHEVASKGRAKPFAKATLVFDPGIKDNELVWQ